MREAPSLSCPSPLPGACEQLHGLIASASEDLRAGLRDLTRGVLLKRCAGYRIDEDRLAEPEQATKAALRAVARRVLAFDEEISVADRRIATGVVAVAPTTLALPGVGPQVAAQLLVSAGDNPERLRNEAALAHLCGAAPLPASSGRRDRHRLNRGGDRQANTALHTIVVSRMKYDQRTRDYVERRTKEGLSKKDIIRCLKRYVVREIYQCLMADFATTTVVAAT